MNTLIETVYIFYVLPLFFSIIGVLPYMLGGDTHE